ncbi:MAG: SAM-dependent methyltransferase [Verrucomicrobia bacterium]|nr:SAM-dependent methyltransferase [Verrucomicrobiota bacterium]
MGADARQEWMDALTAAEADGTLIKVTLGAPRRPDVAARRLLARPVALREGPRLQCVWQLPTRDVTKNFEPAEGLTRIGELLDTEYCVANLFTTRRTAQLEFRKGRAGRVLYSEPACSAAPSVAHDREKARMVSPKRPWLQLLGVTTPEGAVCKGQEGKFRQIHRFVELMDPLWAEAGLHEADPGRALRVRDMGCGKGYLTFALHEHWRSRRPGGVQTVGVELRHELVDQANRAAQDSGCEGLEFRPGEIAGAPREPVDVLVALHACDTATDDALAAGIGAGAALMVVSPCCHREVRSKWVPPAVLAGALRHGIFQEREAEFVTDALRAALLEWAGWHPAVFEFVAPEHTGKNLMIAAVRRPSPNREAAAQRARDLAGFYGIRSQRLADALEFPLVVSG